MQLFEFKKESSAMRECGSFKANAIDTFRSETATYSFRSAPRACVVALALLFGLTALYFFYLPFNRMPSYDYDMHLMYAAQMMRSHQLTVPHPLYHLFAIAIHKLLPALSLDFIIRRVLALICSFALPPAIFAYLIKVDQQDRQQRRDMNISLPIYALLAFAISICGPISFLLNHGLRPFFGYIPLDVFHSPTALLEKPLAIWVFYLTGTLMVTPMPRRSTVLWLALATALALLAKPNYVLALAPVVAIVTTFYFFKKQFSRGFALVFGLLMPAAGVLAWQYYFTYVTQTGLLKSSVIFAPFGPMSVFSGHLGEKFLLSIFCPLLVYLLFFKQAVQDVRLNFAWAVMLSACFFAYFLAESGMRYSSINFGWCAEFALLLVFIATAGFCVNLFLRGTVPRKELLWKFPLAILAFVPHIVGGIFLNFCWDFKLH